MAKSKRYENLKKMTLAELEELLERQNALLKNRRVIESLPDKGESITMFRDLIMKEICYHKQLAQLEDTVNRVTISDTDKHTQRVYSIEKTPEKERYKPSATLNKVKEVKPERRVFAVMEDCSHCNRSARLILLPESMNLLKQQDKRIREEQVKATHSRRLEKAIEDQVREEDSGTESDDS